MRVVLRPEHGDRGLDIADVRPRHARSFAQRGRRDRQAEVQPCAVESTDDRYRLTILMIGAGTMAAGESLTPRNEAGIRTALKHCLTFLRPVRASVEVLGWRSLWGCLVGLPAAPFPPER